MRLIPAYLAEIAAGDQSSALARYGREYGDRIEVDLDALEADHPQLVAQIDHYLGKVRQFRRHPAGAYVAVKVPLLEVQQQDNRQGRVDLTDQLDALERSVLATTVDTLLATTLDVDRLEIVGSAHKAHLQQDSRHRTVCQLTVTGVRDWDRALGGAAGPDEVARILTLTASHATWRDRRVRRLAGVRVDAAVLLPASSAASSATTGGGRPPQSAERTAR